jgi:hypothetical protein
MRIQIALQRRTVADRWIGSISARIGKEKKKMKGEEE